jgi:hypothetical protein
MAINKKLIHFNKKEDFEHEVANGNILNHSIVFIKDSKEIYTHGTIYGGSSTDLSNYATKEELNNKQNTITDLETIRSGAELGATAIQPGSLATVATSGSYNDLTNKPTIPSEVTESTVSNWGFTKNEGTYSKPEDGIPNTDLAQSVQDLLNNSVQAPVVYSEELGGEINTVSTPLRIQVLTADMLFAEGIISKSYNFDMDTQFTVNEEGRLVFTTNQWDTKHIVAFTGDIPKKTSQLTNDSNYVTDTELNNKGYLYKIIVTQAEYDSLTERDPRALYVISDAGENRDSNFVTESQLDNRGYLTQTDKTELEGMQSNLGGRILALEETIARMQNTIDELTRQLENTLIV